MKKNNNVVYADNGKILKYKDTLSDSFELGKTSSLKRGKIITQNIQEKDIEEFVLFNIMNKNYLIKEGTKGQMVTDLIRQKYSLDEELALIANSRVNKDKEEELEFQQWRSLCKDAVKKYLDE